MHEPTIDAAALWEERAALFATLAEEALARDEVLTRLLPGGADGGHELLAYPIAGQGQALVGVGLPAAHAARRDPATLLRRRAAHMERYGAWLPARFEDGSLYLLRRWPSPAGPAWPDGTAQALRHAQELLDE